KDAPHSTGHFGSVVEHATVGHFGGAFDFFLAEEPGHDHADADAEADGEHDACDSNVETDGGAGVGDSQDVDGGTDKQEGDCRAQTRAALPDTGEEGQDGAGANGKNEAADGCGRITNP